MNAPKICSNCGFEIIEDNQPAGFCCVGCAEVYFKLHDMAFDRMEKDLKEGN